MDEVNPAVAFVERQCDALSGITDRAVSVMAHHFSHEELTAALIHYKKGATLHWQDGGTMVFGLTIDSSKITLFS